MRSLTSTIALLFLTLATSAALASPAPYSPEEDARFKRIENQTRSITGDISLSSTGVSAIGAGKVTESQLQSASTPLVLGAQRIARFTYDFAVNGGGQSAHALGVTLPAKSIITRSYLYTVTQVTGASSTVALSCETANNIFSAASMTSITAGTITEGASTGAASAFKPITAACNITATIATANVTAGKVVGWVEYVVAE